MKITTSSNAPVARWISAVKTGHGPNQWYCFRKRFVLNTKTESIPVRIAADSKYWMWINGHLVVREGQLKRGPSPTGTYFDMIDIGPFLRCGSNSVAILLWYFGKHGLSHNDSGKPGLFIHSTGAPAELISDSSWKVIIHPSFGHTDGPNTNFRLPESNILFDARNEPCGWQEPDFDDSLWPYAVDCGAEGSPPWGELARRPIPFWKDYGLKDYENANILPNIGTGKIIPAQLPYNAQVTPYLKISAPAGMRIDIRTDVYHRPYPVRAEYITREGEQEFEVPGWINGHKVLYTIPKSVTIHSLRYRETGYDTSFSGPCDCDDLELNILYKKARRTLYVNMRDHYMDCPDRERAPWFGDIVSEMGASFYAFDSRCHALAQKSILELFAWQYPDGRLHSPVPSGNWGKELPLQILNGIGFYGLWTYFLHTGDTETLRKVYPAAKRYLDLWELDRYGLVEVRKGDWNWGDWGLNVDMPALTNAWYILALDGLLHSAELVGKIHDVEDLRLRLDCHREAFNTQYWNGSGYRSKSHFGFSDIRVQALSVLGHIAQPSKYSRLRKTILRRLDYSFSSPYYEKYILESLFVMGFDTDAIRRMKYRYRGMIRDHSSTLNEHFIKYVGTNNHGWSSGVLTIISQYIVGKELE